MDHLSPELHPAAPTTRERLHDLRTLFSVIASAGHMLGDPLRPEQRAKVLAAIEDASQRGGKITTALLASTTETQKAECCDLHTHIALLEPLLATLAGKRNELRLEAAIRPSLIRCRPERLDHVLLELMANARNSIRGHGVIRFRVRRVGVRVWILVADTGGGMSSAQLDRALGPVDALPVGPHGGGLRQVRAFARETGGRFRLRSRLGVGTVALLVLPVMLPEQTEPAHLRHATGRDTEKADG